MQKINFRVVLAVLVMIGTLVWAFTSTSAQTIAGEDLTVPMTGGPVMITNPGNDTLTARLEAVGTRGAFAISSLDADIPTTSAREGTGSRSIHFIDFQVPPGTTEIQLQRGASVNLTISGNATIVAAAQTASGVQTTYIIAGILILGALFYISTSTGHGWFQWVRRQFSATNVALKNEDQASA